MNGCQLSVIPHVCRAFVFLQFVFFELRQKHVHVLRLSQRGTTSWWAPLRLGPESETGWVAKLGKDRWWQGWRHGPRADAHGNDPMPLLGFLPPLICDVLM